MLIGFIGSPSSGKTTTAALVFAGLKEMGISTEFIPEQARTYIAEKRLALGQAPGSSVHLTDADQKAIVQRQMQYENMLVESSGAGALIITDSSAFNTLMYMSPVLREELTPVLQNHLSRYQIQFYCYPVKMPGSSDPNRVHTQEQALEFDRQIPMLMGLFQVKATILTGTSCHRKSTVIRTILEGLAV